MKLRTKMARKLGFDNFRAWLSPHAPGGLSAADVAAYREQVRLHVTPLVQRFFEQRRAQEGWEKLHAWDEPMVDPHGNVEPAGDEQFLLRPGAENVRGDEWRTR